MHALHSGHSGMLFAGASSPFLLSLPFLLFLFSLSSPPLSVLFKTKNRFGEARARKAATRVAWTASRINLRAVGACEASLLRSEASKPVFWRCQNAKTNKIHCSSKTKNFNYITRIGEHPEWATSAHSICSLVAKVIIAFSTAHSIWSLVTIQGKKWFARRTVRPSSVLV